ncbi:MAG TPA: terminase family protein [Deltaproteobacteria bacterium]|nr:terminase family protein [Deltaproteobacteria bacterium]
MNSPNPSLLNNPILQTCSPESLLIRLARQVAARHKYQKIETYYPEEGKLSRHNYPKHMQFFLEGAKHRERCFLAANRIGKSEGVGGYEVVRHATGIYPSWWKGRRFNRPVSIWVAGDTGTTVRDIIQMKLLGPITDMGSGLIPKNLLHGKPRPKSGNVPDLMETIYVKHITGGVSKIVQKSYKEGRISFQGTEQDVIWLDEEPPLDIYAECLLRTMTTDGLVLCTFTPMEGMTEVVMLYLQDGKIPESGVIYSDSTKIVLEGPA